MFWTRSKGQTIEISRFPDDLEMKCVYDSEASITATYSGSTATTLQEGDVESAKISLQHGFTFASTDANAAATSAFTVGQTMKFTLSYDVTAAGFDNKITQMPFGYFVNKCHVQNADDDTQKFYLIGNKDNTDRDTCPFTSNFFDINLEQEYLGGNTHWTANQYTIEYDAFKIGGSSNLNLVCDIQICLKQDCPTTATCTATL